MIVMWRRAFVEKRRMIVPLVFGIIAVVVLYVAVVFPLSHQVTRTESDERASRDELVKARQDYNSAKATVTGKKLADSALQEFYKDVLPGGLRLSWWHHPTGNRWRSRGSSRRRGPVDPRRTSSRCFRE